MKYMMKTGARCSVVGTNRNIAGSIPGEVIGFFNRPDTSSRIMALVSIQPLTEMSTRNLPGE
jgi:hypothetical protein